MDIVRKLPGNLRGVVFNRLNKTSLRNRGYCFNGVKKHSMKVFFQQYESREKLILRLYTILKGIDGNLLKGKVFYSMTGITEIEKAVKDFCVSFLRGLQIPSVQVDDFFARYEIAIYAIFLSFMRYLFRFHEKKGKELTYRITREESKTKFLQLVNQNFTPRSLGENYVILNVLKIAIFNTVNDFVRVELGHPSMILRINRVSNFFDDMGSIRYGRKYNIRDPPPLTNTNTNTNTNTDSINTGRVLNKIGGNRETVNKWVNNTYPNFQRKLNTLKRQGFNSENQIASGRKGKRLRTQ